MSKINLNKSQENFDKPGQWTETQQDKFHQDK